MPRILDWQSVPWGVVSLTESEPCAGEMPDEAERRATYPGCARAWRTASPSSPTRSPRGAMQRLLGTSGTVTTLASLHLGLAAVRSQGGRRADRARRIDARDQPAAVDVSLADRRQLPCIGQERADLVVAGCAILEAILDIWPADRLGVADRGIREGILRTLMARGAAV